jgi:hypothetical protein
VLNSEHLSVYLNDHLAGASAALELLSALEKAPGLKEWSVRLREEITEDRRALENLMAALHIDQSAIRQTLGKVTGMFGALKTRVEDPSAGDLRRLELLETLSLGIEGKKSLWMTLQTVSAGNSGFPALDFDRLIARAIEQRQEAETQRLQAAKAALA